MSEARTQILARLPRTLVPDTVPAGPPVPAAADTGLAAQFVTAATAHGLVYARTAGAGASRLAVLAYLRQTAVRQVYVSRTIDLAVPGLLDAMIMLDIEVITLENDLARTDETAAQPKPVGAGLLVGAAAWADTGTVVLQFPTRRIALAYVWPPRTLILLPVTRLFSSQRAWLDFLRQRDQLIATFETDCALVSGLSATQDVASTQVTGVYGAGEIRILVIEPEASI